MKKLYVVISAGRSAEEARPVAASSHPTVARATLEAILGEMEFIGRPGSLDRRRLLELIDGGEGGNDV